MMGIDVSAMLKLRGEGKKAALEKFADSLVHWHAEDAAAITTKQPWSEVEAEPENAAARFVEQFGSLLTLHEDPKGILLFPDVAGADGESYDEVIEDLEGDGPDALWFDPKTSKLAPQSQSDGPWLRALKIEHQLEKDNGPRTVVAVDFSGVTVKPELLERLKTLPNLRELTLTAGVDLNAKAIEALASLKHLEILRILKSPITVTDLSGLRKLQLLRRLEIESTSLNDQLVSSLLSLTQLVELKLTRGTATGASLKALARLPKLKRFQVGYVHVADDDLEWFVTWPKLEALDLEPTNITDKGLVILRRLGALKYLNVGRTRITTPGLKNISSLSRLEGLRVSLTAITDAACETIGEMKSLKHLDLSKTKIGGKGLESLKKLKNLVSINLHRTEVEKSELWLLKEFPKLRHIYLSSDLAKSASRNCPDAEVVICDEVLSYEDRYLIDHWNRIPL